MLLGTILMFGIYAKLYTSRSHTIACQMSAKLKLIFYRLLKTTKWQKFETELRRHAYIQTTNLRLLEFRIML